MPPERRPGVAAVSRRRRLLWGGVAAAVLLAAAVFVLRDPGDPAGTAKPASSAPVSTATVTSGDVPIELEGLGRVQAFNTVTVRAQVGGRVAWIRGVGAVAPAPLGFRRCGRRSGVPAPAYG